MLDITFDSVDDGGCRADRPSFIVRWTSLVSLGPFAQQINPVLTSQARQGSWVR
jgi:hypothetical protein